MASRKLFSLKSKAEYIVFSLASLPLAWILLQSHHMLICVPIADRLIAAFPFFTQNSQPAMALAIGMVNFGIFGVLALIFPVQGFGHRWKPERKHGVVILLCIGMALCYPHLSTFLQSTMQTNPIDPFKSMGFVTWTLTPVEEEILFRGFLYALLLKIFRCSPESSWREVLPVLFLGSAWFALWHLYPPAVINHGWNVVLLQVFLTFWSGLLFSVLRHWTGSIWLIIPLHAAGNFMITFF